MALWFASSAGAVTPSRSGKRCVSPVATRTDRPDTSAAGTRSAVAVAAAERGRAISLAANVETTTLYAPTGKKRVDAGNHMQASSLLPSQLAARTTYQCAPWEEHSKRMLRTPNATSNENVLAGGEPQRVDRTPRRRDPTPYGTFDSEEVATQPAARRQKKHVNPSVVGMSVSSDADFKKKRSRTPPANMPDRCQREGFCVLQSSVPTQGGDVQYMAMVELDHCGKSSKHSEKNLVATRERRDAKIARVLQHKRDVQEQRCNTPRTPERPQGIRRSTTPTGSYRVAAPYAVNLPTGRRYDDVGISSVRARSIARERRWRN